MDRAKRESQARKRDIEARLDHLSERETEKKLRDRESNPFNNQVEKAKDRDGQPLCMSGDRRRDWHPPRAYWGRAYFVFQMCGFEFEACVEKVSIVKGAVFALFQDGGFRVWYRWSV